MIRFLHAQVQTSTKSDLQNSKNLIMEEKQYREKMKESVDYCINIQNRFPVFS